MLSESLNSPKWAAYQPTADAPWDRQRVVHLHRRAAFAATREIIERDLAEGPRAAINRLLQGEARLRPPTGEFEMMARTIGDAAQASGSVDRLRAWWFYRMLLSPDPLTERLTLLWHNHFATSNRKLQDLVLMRQQNELFRQHARAPFGEMLAAVVKHPAMLVWLDADSNRAGHPNENLARELLELFTLGIGNYIEADVQAAARALTGWTVGGKAFRFANQRHDDGELELLGRRRRMDGDELLATLNGHPAMARRLAWRLATMFFGEGAVDDVALDELAAGLRERNLSVAWAVETILHSRLFFADTNLRSRVLGPVEFIVGALHALDVCQPPPSTLLLAEWATRMGQELFAPPNVGGWPEGRSWLGSRSIVARSNFSSDLVGGRLWTAQAQLDWRHLRLKRAGEDLEEAVSTLSTLWWGNPSESAEADVLAIAAAERAPNQLSAALVALLVHPAAQLG
jgi:uncharacterized protein (DUF1800 family)